MKVAIIGGAGKMGQWFATRLLQEGAKVVITGRNQAKLKAAGKKLGVSIATNVAAVKQADVVIISVPPENFETVVKVIGPYARDGQIFFDVTSL
jgi:prephenate dehydrogenase